MVELSSLRDIHSVLKYRKVESSVLHSRAILCRAQCCALNNNSRSNDNNNNNNNKHKSSNNNNRSNIYRQNPQESVASLTKTIPNTKPKISGFRIQGVVGGSGGRGGRRGDDDRGNDVVGEEE